MKLRNKKTGKVTTNYDLVALQGVDIDKGINRICLQTEEGDKYAYSSLADFNAEWEDYEEPNGNWTIDPMNENYIDDGKYTAPDELERYEELGLRFNTEEEAEKAVEKLKAWKRLKDKGFHFESWWGGSKDISFWVDTEIDVDMQDDLDLLFGGE